MAVFSDSYAHEVLKFITGQTNTLGTAITPWMALYSTLPNGAGTGGVEETGTKLARKNASAKFGPPASRTVSNNAEIDFGTATGDLNRVYAIGILSASSAGTLYAICRLHGQRYDFLTDYDADINALEVPGHPYQNGDRVMLVGVPGLVLPSGLSEGTTYYVVSSTASTVKLATTSGGAAINLGADGAGFLVKDNSKLIENGDPVKIGVGEFVIELA